MESRIARVLIVVAIGAVACYAVLTTGSMYFGVGVNKGDAVIAEDMPGQKIAGTVTGFGDGVVKVRIEDPAHLGMKLRFPYDQVRVVSRESDEWKRLTGQSTETSD